MLNSLKNWLRTTERRGSERVFVSAPACLLDHRGEREAEILDVSASGLRLTCQAPPEVGQRVGIMVARQALVGTAIWARETCFGLRLLEALDDDGLLAIVEQARCPGSPLVRQ